MLDACPERDQRPTQTRLAAFALVAACACGGAPAASSETRVARTPATKSDRPAEPAASDTERHGGTPPTSLTPPPPPGPLPIDRYFVPSDVAVGPDGPKVITRNIIQDAGGDLWFATWHGAIRYDGNKFVHVNDDAGIGQYRVFSLLRDSKENVWLGTTGAGVYKYDGHRYSNITAEQGLADNTVLSMFEDAGENLWFGSLGVTRFDGSSFTTFNGADGFTDADVTSMAQARTGRMWFGTTGGLFHYDGESFVDFSAEIGVRPDSYIPTLVDRHDHLWFGGANGLYRHDGHKLHHVVESECWFMSEDSKGNIWFSRRADSDPHLRASAMTLNRLVLKPSATEFAPEIVEVATVDGMIFGIFEDRDGLIWFGTTQGIGRIKGDKADFL